MGRERMYHWDWKVLSTLFTLPQASWPDAGKFGGGGNAIPASDPPKCPLAHLIPYGNEWGRGAPASCLTTRVHIGFKASELHAGPLVPPFLPLWESFPA